MTRTILLAAAAIALTAAPTTVRAQHSHHAAMPSHAAATKQHAMKTPCPLHMTGLNTTPAQDSALARVRAAHMADMKQMHASHGADSSRAHMTDPAMKAHMKASMGRALDGMRVVLNETQRQQLAAAVAAHDAEKAEMAKQGMAHDCAACCREHDAKPQAAAKHEH